MLFIPENRLDKLANFYNSEYVKLNRPWILETPFGEWAERQIMKGEKPLEIRFPNGEKTDIDSDFYVPSA